MNRNGPDPWCLPRFRLRDFWFPRSARYNEISQRVAPRAGRSVVEPVARSVARSVSQSVAQSFAQQFRSLGERRLMARRDDSPPEPPIRTELVARVRQEIQLGVYETTEKLEIALHRLLAELASRTDPGE